MNQARLSKRVGRPLAKGVSFRLPQGARLPLATGKTPAQGANSRPPQGVRSQGATKGQNVPSVPTRTYTQNAHAYRPSGDANAPWAKRLLKEYGLGVHDTQSMELSHHPVSAAVRAYLTAQALGFLSKHASICSMYGSGRDVQIHNILSKSVAQPPRLTVYRPNLVGKDLLRKVPADMKIEADGIPNQDSYLFVDVYEGFTPRRILNALAGTTKQLIWIGHQFNGPAGVLFGEGGWIRQPGGILCRPDDVIAPYALHSPCDWIWHQGSYTEGANTLVWVEMLAIGSMRSVLFEVTDLPCQPETTPQIAPSFVEVTAESYQLPGWFPVYLEQWITAYVHERFLERFLHKDTVLVPRSVFNTLVEKNAFRVPSIVGRKQLAASVYDALRSDCDFSLMKALFPVEFGQVTEVLVRAVYSHKLDSRASAMEQDKVYNLPGSMRMHDAMDYEVPMAQRFGKFQILFITLAVVWVAFRAKVRRFGSVLSYSNALKDVLAYAKMRLINLKNLPYRSLLSNALTTIPAKIQQWCVDTRTDLSAFFKAVRTDPDYLESKIVKPVWRGRDVLTFMDVPAIYDRMGGPRTWHQFFLGLETLGFAGLCVTGCAFLLAQLYNNKSALWFVGSVLGEEYLKKDPVWCQAIILFELIMGGRAALGAAFMHVVTGYVINDIFLPWPAFAYNVFIHLMFNIAMTRQRRACLYAKFRDHFYFSPWEERVLWEDSASPKSVERFDPKLAVTPTQEAYCASKISDPSLIVTGDLDLLSNGYAPDTHYYWIIPTSVPGFVPKRSDYNLRMVVQHRLLVLPPLSPEFQAVAWSTMKPLIPQQAPIIWEEWIAPWMAHFDEALKKKRYQKAIREYIKDPQLVNCVPRVNVMVKTDEMLFKRDSDRYVMKPRCIANIDPLIQVAVGPEIYAATEVLKTIWSFDLKFFELRGYQCCITYAGAATDEDLTRWYNQVEAIKFHKFIAIIVSGDDSLVIVNDGLSYRIIEADASMFDQSQSYGPLSFEYSCLRLLGVSAYAIDLIRKVSYLPYCAFSRKTDHKVMISRKERPMRDTGGADTSIGNGINMAFAWLRVLTCHVSFGILGFEMKMIEHESIEDATFLKGMWYRVPDGYFWGPLPSRILKVAKSFRDPGTIYHLPFEKACEAYLNDVACSYAPFLQVPLLRAFVRKWHKSPAIYPQISPYKTQATKNPKPLIHAEALQQVARRYDCSLNDIYEVERMYPDVAFSFVRHPLFEVMAAKDYA